MPERFGLIIDGRIHDSEHFIAVFPCHLLFYELVELLPSVASKRRLRQLLGEQKDVESVSKELRGDNVNLLDFRVWFEGLIALKPPYEHYLKASPEEQQSKYDLLGSIPPTSNGAEQFFSVARTTFGPQRHSQLSYTLGMLLFLRENADF
uniref:HAT C-terminal dimerisation domain-containing protein n=1 Tax=Phytophthora ramorum TaxID=164328 RepID=H3H7M9_PHYRM